MSFNLNSEPKGSFEKKYYHGIGNFKVLAVCPNKTEFKNILNIDLDEEPVYISTNNENKKQVKIVIHLECTKEGMTFRARQDFYIVDEEQVSTGGKKQYCNDKGSFSYESTKDNPKMQWLWQSSGLRVAYSGEEHLIGWACSYFNQTKKVNHDIQIQDVKALFTGNLSEIKSWFIEDNKKDQKGEDREVKLAVGIKQITGDSGTKFVQVVYNRASGRSWSDNTKIIDELTNHRANGGLNSIYYGEGSFELTSVTDPSKLAFFSADNPADLVGSNGVGENGLPF